MLVHVPAVRGHPGVRQLREAFVEYFLKKGVGR